MHRSQTITIRAVIDIAQVSTGLRRERYCFLFDCDSAPK